MPLSADEILDAQGLVCPEPLMLARNQLRSMRPGQVLHILATDPSTERDFAQLCRFMGHELVANRHEGRVLEFWIRRAS